MDNNTFLYKLLSMLPKGIARTYLIAVVVLFVVMMIVAIPVSNSIGGSDLITSGGINAGTQTELFLTTIETLQSTIQESQEHIDDLQATIEFQEATIFDLTSQLTRVVEICTISPEELNNIQN